MRYAAGWAVSWFLFSSTLFAQTEKAHAGAVYKVDCGKTSARELGEYADTELYSLEQVNTLTFLPDDTLLFRRGTSCKGSLQPKGQGFSVGAYGSGPLPRIEANRNDEAALLLVDQQHIAISSLELVGGTKYGVHISATNETVHSISLTNLTVRNVRGNLKEKASGLVVITANKEQATFDDVVLDGVRAFGTTQWSGIFISGGSKQHPATRVRVVNSVVHDVQGDGIVLFNAVDSSIEHSLAWHTGMQHQQTIGTPNAIWTWQCARCLVADNEAFLTDSPGVDGGAFDIDWGNAENTFQKNYGHDTQGYCISVFAANGPTTKSVVDGNVCINNGLSPRLAERQGAILLMTWNSGTIDGLTISNNLVDWQPGGNTPAIRAGTNLQADHVVFTNNKFTTEVTPLIDPELKDLMHDEDLSAQSLAGSLLVEAAGNSGTAFRENARSANQARMRWRLVSDVPKHKVISNSTLNGMFVDLLSASLQYEHSGLSVELRANEEVLALARDWQLRESGITFPRGTQDSSYMITLLSPVSGVTRRWKLSVPLADLGLTLRTSIGKPDFSGLSFEDVKATD